MTWAEFKADVEAAGVKDEMEIDWIDVHLPSVGGLEVMFDFFNRADWKDYKPGDRGFAISE